MSIQICEYCGEYKHECKCAAATKIAELTQRISELESECQNHVEHLTAKYQQGLAEGREKGLREAAEIVKKQNGSLSIRRLYERDIDAILSATNKKESPE